jgi:hypothetical protein
MSTPRCSGESLTDPPLCSAARRGKCVAARGSGGGLLLVSHSAQEGRGAGTVGEGAQNAQGVVAVNAYSGREAVEVHPNASELCQQLFESSLVSHALMPFATPAPRFRDDGAWLTH